MNAFLFIYIKPTNKYQAKQQTMFVIYFKAKYLFVVFQFPASLSPISTQYSAQSKEDILFGNRKKKINFM